MECARLDFHQLLDNATSIELRAGTDGTKWTNEQLLPTQHYDHHRRQLTLAAVTNELSV